MLKISPIVTWQILTWPVKKRTPLFQRSTLKSNLMRLELKTYQDVKQLWTKWAKFKRYVKLWKEEAGFFLLFYFVLFLFLLFSLVFHACFLFLQITKKNKKQKQDFFFPHNGVRSWLAYPESLHFWVLSLFLICDVLSIKLNLDY